MQEKPQVAEAKQKHMLLNHREVLPNKKPEETFTSIQKQIPAQDKKPVSQPKEIEKKPLPEKIIPKTLPQTKKLPLDKTARLMQAVQKIQHLIRKKAKERIFIMSFPLLIRSAEITTYVFWLSSKEKVCVDMHQEGRNRQELLLGLNELGIHSLQELKSSSQLDALLLPFISYSQGSVWFKKHDNEKRANPK